MLIAVIDATNPTAQRFAAEAGRHRHRIRALHPEPERADVGARTDVIPGRATDGGAVRECIRGVDAVVLCQEAAPARGVTTRTTATQHVLAAMEDEGVLRLVVLGDADIPTPREGGEAWRDEIRDAMGERDLKDVEDVVKMTQLVENSDREWTVIRVEGLADGMVRDAEAAAKAMLDALEHRKNVRHAVVVEP